MSHLQHLSILIVDDDADLTQYWTAQLARVFKHVYKAGHAFEALEVLHRKHPDVVLIDVDLPEMNGLAFCQDLKRHAEFAAIPVILYKSGYLTLEDKRLGMQSGAERLVSKPGSVKEVIQLIEDTYAASRVSQFVTTDEVPALPSKEGGYADYLTRQLGETIAQLKKEQQTLNTFLNRYQDFANCVGDFFWETDAQGCLTFVGAAAGNRLELPTSDYANKPFKDFFSSYFSDDSLEELLRLQGRGGRFSMSCEINREQALRVVRVVGHPYYAEPGGLAGFRGAIVDITDAQLNSEKLYFAAHHDALTGLLNARAFELTLKNAMQALGEDEQHVLCYLDLDFFKEVNDTAGHRAGDEVLSQIADLFRKRVRANDVLARIGGDEFAILLRHCSMDQARRLIQDLHNSVKTNRFFWEGHSFELGLSIGLVEIHTSSLTAEEVMDFADQACYSAKHSGRNQIRVYGEEHPAAGLAGDALWLERFHHAINEDELCLFAQPIEPARSITKAGGCEILVRMRTGEKLVTPEQFISVVDRYQLSNILDRWVVNHVIEWLESQVVTGIRLDFYSINLSTSSVCDEAFRSQLFERLKRSPVVARKLCFEIVESTAMENLENALEFIKTMRTLGCRFALDDFGTGFSSLAHLKNLPVDYVKLDGLFIRGITHDAVDRGLVQSIQHIASLMDIQTIAEYVETPEIEAELKELGIDYVQGFHVGYPEMVVLPFAPIPQWEGLPTAQGPVDA